MKPILVVSDLHVGAGELDDCDRELEALLVEFLAWLPTAYSPLELVINGDFLDFVQASPWDIPDLESSTPTGVPLCFTQDQSVRKVEAILTAHRPIFAALGKLLAENQDNTLVVLPGNHDADFFWKAVRTRFAGALAQGTDFDEGQLRFHLEPVYRPINCARAWIEHGHQYDPINSFYVPWTTESGEMLEPKLCWSLQEPPIFTSKNGENRLFECVGTRFLIKFLNDLDAQYPFVDNVKPFSRFLKLFGASVTAEGYGFSKAAVSVWSMLRFLGNRLARSPEELLSHERATEGDASALVQAILRGMSASRKRALADRLVARGFELNGPLEVHARRAGGAEGFLMFLQANLDICDEAVAPSGGFLGAGSPGTLSLAKGFGVDETELLRSAARHILAHQDVEIVVMGHTHQRVEEPRYVNSGCWTRYYTFTPGEKRQSWQVLRSGSYSEFPYQLNYVEIVPQRTPLAMLRTFRERLS